MADVQVYGTVHADGEKRLVRGVYMIDTLKGACVFKDSSSDLLIRRTTDGGATWATTTLYTGTIVKFAVWFDQERSGDTGTLLHIAWIDDDATNFGVYYRTFDIDDASLGTERNPDNTNPLSESPALSEISLTLAENGNILLAYRSYLSEVNLYRSGDGGATWDDRTANLYPGTSGFQQALMFPANGTGDTADICAFFWNGSTALELEMYDDSADSFSTTAIATIADPKIDDADGMDGAVRHSDGHIIFACWDGFDLSTADLKVWDVNPDDISSPTVTAKTDVLTDTAEAHGCAVFINQDTDDIYVFYLKGSAWASTVGVKYKKSTDGGATWGSEQSYSVDTDDDLKLVTCGRTSSPNGESLIMPLWFNEDLQDIFVNTDNALTVGSAGGGVSSPKKHPVHGRGLVPALNLGVPRF